MRNNILNIRADATSDIGSGHIMRSIALGQAFKKCGGIVNFISNCTVPAIEDRINDEGFHFFKLSNNTNKKDELQTLKILKSKISQENIKTEQRKEWVILDGYHFGPAFQKSILKNGFKVIIIDDYNHQKLYHADIILNQNTDAKALNYRTYKNTVILGGFKYALIRKEFINHTIKHKAHGNNTNILITMGGSDPKNVTEIIIRSLLSLDHTNFNAKILVGPGYNGKTDLKNTIDGFDHIELIKNGDMTSLMEWADISVTAAGSTCLELCYMGVPFISIITNENQKFLADSLEQAGVSVNLGWFHKADHVLITQTLNSLIENTEKRKKMAQLSKKLVDGKGPYRILQQMEKII